MIQRKTGILSEGISRRWGLWVFAITLFLILFESIFFWRESLFYLDGSKVLFELVDQEWFSYMHNRFAMAITQILPIVALRLNVDIQAVYLIQSLSFALPPLIPLFVITFIFKDYRSIVLILFFYVLGSAEIHYIKEWGAYAALYLVIMTASFFQTYFKEEKKKHWIIAVFLMFLTINTHPSTACFFAIFFLLRYKNYKLKFRIGYISIIAMSLFIAVTINMYVGARVNEALELVLLDGSIIEFLKRYLVQYEMIAVYIAALGVLIYQPRISWRHILAILAPLACLALIFSFLTRYNYNSRDAFYYECQVFLILIAFLYFPIHKLVQIRSVYLILFVVACTRFFVLNYGPDNRNHANIVNNENLLKELNTTYPDKNMFVVDRNSQLTMEDFPDFFIFYESYLMSLYLFGEDNGRVIYLTNDNNIYFDDNGLPIFFNYVGAPNGKINFDDPTTYGGFLDPTNLFPRLKVNKSTIQKL